MAYQHKIHLISQIGVREANMKARFTPVQSHRTTTLTFRKHTTLITCTEDAKYLLVVLFMDSLYGNNYSNVGSFSFEVRP